MSTSMGRTRLVAFAIGLFWMTSVSAQQLPANPLQGSNITGPFNPIASLQFWLCAMTVLFGLIVLGGQFILLRRVEHLTSDDIAKNCSISIVIVGALLLIIAGYDSQQTAQAFGLFGTVIGYLLGREAGRKDPKISSDRSEGSE